MCMQSFVALRCVSTKTRELTTTREENNYSGFLEPAFRVQKETNRKGARHKGRKKKITREGRKVGLTKLDTVHICRVLKSGAWKMEVLGSRRIPFAPHYSNTSLLAADETENIICPGPPCVALSRFHLFAVFIFIRNANGIIYTCQSATHVKCDICSIGGVYQELGGG